MGLLKGCRSGRRGFQRRPTGSAAPAQNVPQNRPVFFAFPIEGRDSLNGGTMQKQSSQRMTVKTRVRAGRLAINRNQSVAGRR